MRSKKIGKNDAVDVSRVIRENRELRIGGKKSNCILSGILKYKNGI